MTILKPGDPNVSNKPKRFKCDVCGCVFDANKGEYRVIQQYNDIGYQCECPCCKEQVEESDTRELLVRAFSK